MAGEHHQSNGSGARGWTGVVALGLLTITTYGSWFYGFGVLIGPIHDDVGWTTTTLGLTYGAAHVISGLGSFLGGRLLDRFGGVGPFGVQAVVGGGLLLGSTWADRPALFVVLYATGAGIVGATGFYHVTTAAASRLRSDRPDKAIAIVTVIGALCSPIYLPATAWMVTVWHWRTVARVLALLAIAGAVLALALARGGASDTPGGPTRSPFVALRRALANSSVRRMLAVYFAAGIAFSSVLVYQVPILTGAGITLGTAGAIGGLRGFCQIFGRVGLTGAVGRFGVGALLRASYLVSAAGVALLLVGTIPAGIAYGFVAGAALGASGPLQAMYARQHFEEADLGLLMGLQGAAMGLAGGVGPLLGGVLNDWTNRWSPTIVMATGTLLVAGLLLAPSSRPESAHP